MENQKLDWRQIVIDIIRLRNDNFGRGEIISEMVKNESKYLLEELGKVV